jgi:Zn ribbon nucleic-acid-binding protein
VSEQGQLFDDDGGAVCPRCKGTRRIWSERVGAEIPCPDCGATEGIKRTDKASDADPAWRAKAEFIWHEVCEQNYDFSMDDIHAHFDRTFPDATTHFQRDERRRWGAVARFAMKQGWCESTGRYTPSERRHKAPLLVYRSLLWRR